MTNDGGSSRHLALLTLVGAALVACGNDDDSGPGAGGGTSSGGTPSSGGTTANGGSSSGGGPTGSSTTVSGAVTLPSDATGACAMVAVDDDTTGSNDAPHVLYAEVTGTSVDFSFSNVDPGTYYLWSYVDVDGSDSDPGAGCVIQGAPASGDFLGYYGSAGEPSAPNVTVPNDGSAFDFEAGVFP